MNSYLEEQVNIAAERRNGATGREEREDVVRPVGSRV